MRGAAARDRALGRGLAAVGRQLQDSPASISTGAGVLLGPEPVRARGRGAERELVFLGEGEHNGRSGAPELGGRGCHAVFLAPNFSTAWQLLYCVSCSKFPRARGQPGPAAGLGEAPGAGSSPDSPPITLVPFEPLGHAAPSPPGCEPSEDLRGSPTTGSPQAGGPGTAGLGEGGAAERQPTAHPSTGAECRGPWPRVGVLTSPSPVSRAGTGSQQS